METNNYQINIDNLKNWCLYIEDDIEDKSYNPFDDLNQLQKLVDKAGPKKFKRISKYEFECPTCKEVYDLNKVDYDYCPNCSQKIDWSDFV